MSILRSLARNRAKTRMKKKGMRRVCSKQTRGKSWFSENWREYVV